MMKKLVISYNDVVVFNKGEIFLMSIIEAKKTADVLKKINTRLFVILV